MKPSNCYYDRLLCHSIVRSGILVSKEQSSLLIAVNSWLDLHFEING